jgi:hypothetical protein
LGTARLLQARQQESNPSTSTQVSFLFPIILVMFSFFNTVSHRAVAKPEKLLLLANKSFVGKTVLAFE